MKNKILTIIVILIYTAVCYYLMIPAINITAPEFWSFLANIVIVGGTIYNLSNLDANVDSKNGYIKITDLNKGKSSSKVNKVLIGGFVVVYASIFIFNIFLSPLISSNNYATRIVIENGDFTTDIDEVDFTKLPLLDKNSSTKLGDRTMGEMSEWVSQFTVSDQYTQINYNDDIIRVTPLEYSGLIKYFGNKSEGVQGYITVNSVDGTSNLVKLEEGMKYMPSAFFNEDLMRKLRFEYPTKIFGDEVFEIDEEGNPHWIVPTISYKGVGLLKEVEGIIIMSAITGESKYYSVDNVPSWVDHVYSSELIVEQIDDWGTYVNGFFNSIFSQKNVVNTTDGYNYLIIDEDVYLYTGITSVLSDESNLGFILVNLRTKEATYYTMSGAEEYSAMASAEGLVQEKGYDASFPLLINLGGNATYMLSLKDSAGLVKMYAFVNVVDYQIVSATDSSFGIDYAVEEYLSKVGNNVPTGDVIESEIKVSDVITATIGGNTVYYITDTSKNNYQVYINVNESLLPFLKTGDKVTIKYTEGDINKITDIKK
ncbi:MAG: CvpA family protein [bacterium]